jgi:hypothetical protein
MCRRGGKSAQIKADESSQRNKKSLFESGKSLIIAAIVC